MDMIPILVKMKRNKSPELRKMKTNLYLVRDINSPIYFHQSTNIFFNEIWCYDYFNDAVKCILMPLQGLEKVG